MQHAGNRHSGYSSLIVRCVIRVFDLQDNGTYLDIAPDSEFSQFLPARRYANATYAMARSLSVRRSVRLSPAGVRSKRLDGLNRFSHTKLLSAYPTLCWVSSKISELPFPLFQNLYLADFTARSELRKVLFLAPSACVFWLCMKYLGNR